MNTEIVTWMVLLLNSFLVYYSLCVFFKRKIHNIFMGGFVYVLICMGMRIVTNLFEGSVYWAVAYIILVVQVLMLYLFFHVSKWYYPWIAHILITVVMLFLQIPAAWMAEFITGVNVLEEGNLSTYDLNYVLVSSLTCMLYLIVFAIAFVTILSMHYSISRWIYVATMGLIIYQSLVVMFFYMLCWRDGDNAVLGATIFTAFGIMIDIVVLKSMENFLEKRKVEQEWQRLSLLRQREYEYYQKLQNEIEKMRMERHDYINYLQAMERLIKDGQQYDDVKKMIYQLQQTYNDTDRIGKKAL